MRETIEVFMSGMDRRHRGRRQTKFVIAGEVQAPCGSWRSPDSDVELLPFVLGGHARRFGAEQRHHGRRRFAESERLDEQAFDAPEVIVGKKSFTSSLIRHAARKCRLGVSLVERARDEAVRGGVGRDLRTFSSTHVCAWRQRGLGEEISRSPPERLGMVQR